MTTKILFILKKRQTSNDPGSWNYSTGDQLDSGLFISANQVVAMLQEANIETNLVQVVDNNEIDKWVAHYRPTHVVIEAFWVIPEKFDILKKLHPSVTWIIRCHSKVDFLSHEGIVFSWVLDYIQRGIYVGCNSQEAVDDFQELARILELDSEKIIFLPNFYKTTFEPETEFRKLVAKWKTRGDSLFFAPTPKIAGQLNVGCFGAIRPLKNHMAQALAAINVADYIGLDLQFHISSSRVEGQVGGTLKATRALFQRTGKHKLIEVPWLPHSEFIAYINSMDINFQVSMSETFNIVCADSVDQRVPVIASSQIPWLSEEYVVKQPNNVQDITSTAISTYMNSGSGVLAADQLVQLVDYCREAKSIWESRFK